MIIAYIIKAIRSFFSPVPPRDYEAEIAIATEKMNKAKRQKKKHSHYARHIERIRSEQLAEELGLDLARTDFSRM